MNNRKVGADCKRVQLAERQYSFPNEGRTGRERVRLTEVWHDSQEQITDEGSHRLPSARRRGLKAPPPVNRYIPRWPAQA